MNFVAESQFIYSGVKTFLENLRKPNAQFSYFPALSGVTENGKKLNLGFSCYALKIKFMIGQLNKPDKDYITSWVTFINSFQKNNSMFPDNSYIDPALLESYNKLKFNSIMKEAVKLSLSTLKIKQFESKVLKLKKAINAETKQAISTLYEVNNPNKKLIQNEYENFDSLNYYLEGLDWQKPWDAGAQFSSLCVYSKTQNFNFDTWLIEYIAKKVDEETGSYFSAMPSNSRQVINGAMKVITGLDWLGHEIHYPKKLIDYCLKNRPILEGCDIVDYVYTLYKCSQQTDHKKKEVNIILSEILEDIINLYYRNEGGFSYFVGKSQSHYYGVKITNSHETPDLHGTLLCVWAINMILDNLQILESDKHIIKP